MINIIESINKSSTDGVDASKKLATSTFKYTKLKAFYFTGLTATSIAKLILIGSFLSIGLIFLSVFGAIALGNHFNDVALGYLTVAGIYFFIAFVFLLLRKQIEKVVLKKLSEKFFN